MAVEHSLIYAIVWSFGGFLTHQNKIIFDRWWRSTFNQANPSLCFPEHGLLWDYYTKASVQGFLAWRDNVPKFTIPNKNDTFFVPNLRAAATQHLVNQLINRGMSVLLTGPDGSGKTLLLQDVLSRSRLSDTSLLHIYTNHFTSSKVVWEQMFEYLEWHWGKRYTPKGCKNVLTFIDDLHNTEVC